MTKVEQLERHVRELTAEELASFRDWFAAILNRARRSWHALIGFVRN